MPWAYCGVIASVELVFVFDLCILWPCLPLVAVVDDDMLSLLDGDDIVLPVVLPVDGDDIVSPGIAPVPVPVPVAAPEGIVAVVPVEPVDPAVCAVAAVASIVAVIINKVFILILLRVNWD